MLQNMLHQIGRQYEALRTNNTLEVTAFVEMAFNVHRHCGMRQQFLGTVRAGNQFVSVRVHSTVFLKVNNQYNYLVRYKIKKTLFYLNLVS